MSSSGTTGVNTVTKWIIIFTESTFVCVPSALSQPVAGSGTSARYPRVGCPPSPVGSSFILNKKVKTTFAGINVWRASYAIPVTTSIIVRGTLCGAGLCVVFISDFSLPNKSQIKLCACYLRVPLVHSQINHFRQKPPLPKKRGFTDYSSATSRTVCTGEVTS